MGPKSRLGIPLVRFPSRAFTTLLAPLSLATNLVTYITDVIGGNPGFAAILVSSRVD